MQMLLLLLVLQLLLLLMLMPQLAMTNANFAERRELVFANGLLGQAKQLAYAGKHAGTYAANDAAVDVNDWHDQRQFT